jgi:hypothetical protein
VVEHPRFFLREYHDSPGPVGEPLEHEINPVFGCVLWTHDRS